MSAFNREKRCRTKKNCFDKFWFRSISIFRFFCLKQNRKEIKISNESEGAKVTWCQNFKAKERNSWLRFNSKSCKNCFVVDVFCCCCCCCWCCCCSFWWINTNSKWNWMESRLPVAKWTLRATEFIGSSPGLKSKRLWTKVLLTNRSGLVRIWTRNNKNKPLKNFSIQQTSKSNSIFKNEIRPIFYFTKSSTLWRLRDQLLVLLSTSLVIFLKFENFSSSRFSAFYLLSFLIIQLNR